MSESSIFNSLNLGSAKSILENKPDSPLGRLLTELTDDVIKQLQERLVARDINASGGLSQSINPTDVTIDGDYISVGITMDFYWKYVNYGVKGREINKGWGESPPREKTFLEAIREWIPHRGLTLPEGFRNYDSFAWAIMINKIKTGQEPRPFFTDVVNESLVGVLKEPIEKLLGRAIEINIVEPWQ